MSYTLTVCQQTVARCLHKNRRLIVNAFKLDGISLNLRTTIVKNSQMYPLTMTKGFYITI